MSPTAGNGSSKPQTWSARLMGAFTGPGPSGGSEVKTDPAEILPAGERKAAMSTLDQMEAKWALIALILATVAGIAIPIYFIAENKVTKAGKNSIAVAPDAKLLGAVILVICAVGLLALWKRKRTLVAFALFLVGFAFTIFVGLKSPPLKLMRGMPPGPKPPIPNCGPCTPCCGGGAPGCP